MTLNSIFILLSVCLLILQGNQQGLSDDASGFYDTILQLETKYFMKFFFFYIIDYSYTTSIISTIYLPMVVRSVKAPTMKSFLIEFCITSDLGKPNNFENSSEQ